MHHIYHTLGFILSSRNVGEANKSFTLYTDKLGLVRATAQGVRLHESKLRFSLQDFSYCNIDLVKGRDIWRITSATKISSFPLARKNKKSIAIIAQVSKLVERLCYGEEANSVIFANIIQTFKLLDVDGVEKSFQEALEIYLVLNIMNALGYIGESEILDEYLGQKFEIRKIENLLKDKQSIISHINKALNESQL